MSTTAAVVPVEVVLSRRLDFPTWLPAMLVKELRQGLRARGFVGTLVAFQMIMMLFMVFAIAGGTGSGSFNTLQAAYWLMLNVQLLIITPARALMGLQAEIDAKSIDLLMLTRLTAWRIVVGKWISLLVQAALLVVAMLPYGVARYFFGSVDLAGEAKLISFLFAGSAVLTAAALWSSAMPRVTRVALGIGVVFVWQFLPFSLPALFGMSGGRSPRMGTGISLAGGPLWLMLLDAAVVLVLCLAGAVRRLAPAAESQAPLMRLLPLLAFLPLPFLRLPLVLAQASFGAILLALVAAIELGRDEQARFGHWKPWASRGRWGRIVGRWVQPGWASAMEWVLVVATAIAIAGLATSEPVKIAQLSMLAAEAMIFPALILTGMSAQFTQRAAGYVLVLGAASLISAVGSASATLLQFNKLADMLLLLLPVSSFWSTATARVPLTNNIIIAQVVTAAVILGAAWWRARPDRARRRQFQANFVAAGAVSTKS